MSETNRQWRLARRPQGMVRESDSYSGANFGKQLLEL